MNRRKFIAGIASAIGVGLAGCSDNPENTAAPTGTETLTGTETGTPTATEEQTDSETEADTETETQTEQGVLSTAVSDQPGDITDFDELLIPVEKVWVHPKNIQTEAPTTTESETATGTEEPSGTPTRTPTDSPAETVTTQEETVNTPVGSGSGGGAVPEKGDVEEDGKIVLDIEDAKVDLTELVGEAQAVIGNHTLPAGTYEQIKLWVGDDIEATLKDGSSADVVTPGNAPLKFNKEFRIEPETRTTFVADFTPVKRGPNGYILKPVASEVEVSYEELETETATPEPNGTPTRTPTEANKTGTPSGTPTRTPETESETEAYTDTPSAVTGTSTTEYNG